MGGTPSFKAHNAKALIQLWEQIFRYASVNDHTKEMEIYSSLTALLTNLLNEGKAANAASYSSHNAHNL